MLAKENIHCSTKYTHVAICIFRCTFSLIMQYRIRQVVIFISRFLNPAGQIYIRLLMLSLRRIFSFPGKKAKVAFLKGQAFPRFLVFGEEATIHSLRRLFKRNGLTGKHHFVVASEVSAADGHASPFISLKGFTHVVYDCRAFSFSTIIRLLSRHRKMGLRLGIYNPESRVLVTPEKCYL